MSVQLPLVTDLDGTLIRSDVGLEAVLAGVRQRPVLLLGILWSLPFTGLAAGKRRLATAVELAADRLPYNREFLSWLQAAQASGRPVYLATASDQQHAAAVARHCDGLFSGVYASDGNTNLKGIHKAELLVREFGVRGFDYAGDARVDAAVWQQSRRGILVNGTAAAERCLQASGAEVEVHSRRPALLPALWRALRPHQWLKNLLVLVPMLAAFQPAAAAGLAVLAFCCAASASYLLNDLLDLQQDRQDPGRQDRPICAGALPLAVALWCAPLLAAAGLLLAAVVNSALCIVLSVYLLVSAAYTLQWKKHALLDTFVLAGLYTLRIIGGGAAAMVAVSDWLLAFAMFLFFALALVKRISALCVAPQLAGYSGRGYRAADLPLLVSLCAASSIASVLVFALYINSTAVHAIYSLPGALWLICLALAGWLCRMLLQATRGEIVGDPLVHMLADRAGIMLIMVALLAIPLAAWG